MLPVVEIVSTRSPRVTVAVSSLLAGWSAGCVGAQPHHATGGTSTSSSGSTPAWRRVRRRIAELGIDCTDAIVTPPGLPSLGGSLLRFSGPRAVAGPDDD